MSMTLIQVITLLYSQISAFVDHEESGANCKVKVDDPEHGLIDIVQIETTGEKGNHTIVIHTERS